jgi:3-deoxy-D-manno-octulosonate 8-phosphate phosphatase (KDO 8-P phosphatase)
MKLVGLPTCLPNRNKRNFKIYFCIKNGGKGAVRDVIEQVMKVQGKWMESLTGN